MSQPQKTPPKDLTERLQRVHKSVLALDVPDEAADIKNNALIAIERQLVIGIDRQLMARACDYLEQLADTSIGYDPYENVLGLADGIFMELDSASTSARLSDDNRPAPPDDSDDPDDNPPSDLDGFFDLCQSQADPNCKSCAGRGLVKNKWGFIADCPACTPPPDEITECDDCGGAFFDLVGDGLCAACAMPKICDDCGCDVDWLNEDDLCQSCAPLVSDRDVSPCECGGLQVCYCDDIDDNGSAPEPPKQPQNDLTERLEDFAERLETFPIVIDSQRVFKNRALCLVEKQLVSGINFDTMLEIVYLLEKAMPPGPVVIFPRRLASPWEFWAGEYHILAISNAFKIFDLAREIVAGVRRIPYTLPDDSDDNGSAPAASAVRP
jgi:hypothetical protein